MWFDGMINVVGATSATYETYRNHIMDRLSVPSPLDIELKLYVVQRSSGLVPGKLGPRTPLSLPLQISSGETSARIKVVAPFPDTALKAYFVLYENDVDGRYDYVVRDILTPEGLGIAEVGDSVLVVKSFALEPEWQPEHMGIAFFVQSDSSKSVLQAVQELLAPHVVSRGDADDDGFINVVDAVYLISFLFKGGPPPVPELWYADVNCDDDVDIADVVYLINYLFKSGASPCQ